MMRLARCAAAIASLLLSPACKTTGDPPGLSQWIPLDQKDGLLTFPLSINGQPAHAAFDSHVQMVRVDPAFAEKIGFVGTGGTVIAEQKWHGAAYKKLVSPFTLELVGEHGPRPFAKIVDADVLQESVGPELLISLQLFRAYVLQIDYPGSRFRYLTRLASKVEEEANAKMRVLRNGRVQVLVTMNGADQWLFLDPSRGGAIYLPRTAMRTAGLEHAQKIAGETAERYMVASLEIGPFELENVRVEVQDEDAARTEYRDVLWFTEDGGFGRVGVEILRHFVVTLDFENERMHLYSP